MITINFENSDKGLCIICDRPTIIGRMTCSDSCHEKFIEFCEEQYGVSKNVVDQTTGITYKVPTRDIVERGLKWKDLAKYPRLEENEVVGD